jgi:hypothetical protein
MPTLIGAPAVPRKEPDGRIVWTVYLDASPVKAAPKK